MIVTQAAMEGAYNSFSTIFNQAFAGVEDQSDLVATTVPSTGAQVNYKWLGEIPGMREWIDERVISNLEAHDFTIVNKDFEMTVGVDRNDIEDEQLGTYAPLFAQMGHAAAVHPSQLVYSLLPKGFTSKCYDGQYFFDTDHPVGEGFVSNFGGGTGTGWYLLDLSRPIKPLIKQIRKKPEMVKMDAPKDPENFMRKKIIYGTDDRKNAGFGLWQLAWGDKRALDAANYEEARVALSSQKNAAGAPLGVQGTHLLVPPTLESAGKAVLEKERIAGGEDNIWFGTAKLVVCPWLA